LKTKLHIPAIHQDIVSRPRLLQRLDSGVNGKLTLISATAGFGKSTLLSNWVQQTKAHTRIAWLSLEEGDNDLSRFLIYFVAALQTIEINIGQGVLVALHSPGVVNVEVVLTTLINDIAELPEYVVLVLDDYHVIESHPIDHAMTFLLDHLSSQVHLVIASRIDPSFPLPRLRTRRQMTEIRAKDLRITTDEATSFSTR
jgi:LuxR family maltose regulon positive regulatory protein